MSGLKDLKRVFGFGSRITRSTFWFRVIGIWIVFAALSSPLSVSNAATIVFNLIVLVALLATCVQRLHDRNRSGWWMLLSVIPVIGALWLVWQLAFKRGITGDNRWGIDKLNRTPDFLVVR